MLADNSRLVKQVEGLEAEVRVLREELIRVIDELRD